MPSIYSPIGLRDFALYLDELLEQPSWPVGFASQNELGELAGVPPNTIKSIRRNRDLTEERFAEGYYHAPKIETILALAPFLPDPKTGAPFDPNGHPCRLEAVLRGWEPLRPEKEVKHPAIAIITDAYRRDKAAFEQAGLTRASMNRLLQGEYPSVGELLQLQEALRYQDLGKLLDLYQIPRDLPLGESDRPNGKPNGKSKQKA